MRCELSRISCWLWKCFVFNFRLLFFFFFVFILTRNPFEFYFAWLLNGNGNPFEWDFDFVLSVEFKLWEFQWISSSPSISLHRKTLFYIVVVVPFYHSLISPSIDEILYIISTGRLFKTSLRLSSTFPPDIFREKKLPLRHQVTTRVELLTRENFLARFSRQFSSKTTWISIKYVTLNLAVCRVETDKRSETGGNFNLHCVKKSNLKVQYWNKDEEERKALTSSRQALHKLKTIKTLLSDVFASSRENCYIIFVKQDRKERKQEIVEKLFPLNVIFQINWNFAKKFSSWKMSAAVESETAQ